ncbi:hypothetical protein ABZ286_000071 [Listeria monocytogenes]|nr:hypothetical protein [Listeria monocytogenes]EAG2102918.1 hypothetical protein [Listeria monocytogenes]
MGKSYWYNEGTDTLLTEKEWLEDLREDEEELDESDKTSLETLIQLSYENESDFVLSDNEGNKLEEW